jgi:hypothetical protein
MSRDTLLPVTGTRCDFVASSPDANLRVCACGLWFSPAWMCSVVCHQQLQHRRTLKLTRAAGWLSWQPDGSIRGSWPTAFFGYPRGRTVVTEAWCRSTLAKLSIGYSPSTLEPQTSERMLHQQNAPNGSRLSSCLRCQFRWIEACSFLPKD